LKLWNQSCDSQCTECCPFGRERQQIGLSEANKDKRERQHKLQARTLYLCLSLLLNMAEDAAVERKLRKRDIVRHLSQALERKNTWLVGVALEFLRKLSLDRENLDRMTYCNVAERLVRIMNFKSDYVLHLGARLALNISFDSNLRDEMVRAGMIYCLVQSMRKPHMEQTAACVLFNLARSEKSGEHFAACDAAKLVCERLSQANLSSCGEIAALALRMAQTPQNAATLSRREVFHRLIDQAMQDKNLVAFKLLRCIAENLEYVESFEIYIEDMLECLKDPKAERKLKEEIFATVSSLLLTNTLQAPLQTLIQDCSIIPFTLSRLDARLGHDERVLEAIVFLGAAACEHLAADLTSADAPLWIIAVVKDKGADADVARASAWALGRMGLYKPTRDAILADGRALTSLIEMLEAGDDVYAEASKALDVFVDHDPEWADYIRSAKFRSFNASWLNE
jgi:hypothetical protein